MLIDISAGGAGVACPSPDMPHVRRSEEVLLRFEAPGRLHQPLELIARVTNLVRGNTHTRLGLSFEMVTSDRAKLDPRLRSLFNERRAFRVSPPDPEPVHVDVASMLTNHSIVAAMRDISILGIGLRCAEETSRHLDSGSLVGLKFTLNGQEEQLSTRAIVRHTHVDRFQTHRFVGLEFEHDSPQVDHPNTQAITDYVMLSQLEARRRLKGME